MKHAYQKRLHDKAVEQAKKVYAYYLERKDADSTKSGGMTRTDSTTACLSGEVKNNGCWWGLKPCSWQQSKRNRKQKCKHQ